MLGARVEFPGSPRRDAAKFIILNTKFLVFDTQFLVVNAKFLVLNTKFIIFTNLRPLQVALPEVESCLCALQQLRH